MKKNIPTVKTWCLPDGLGENKLLVFHLGIVNVMAGFLETGVKDEKDMLNLFPRDHMTYGLGSEIKVEISDLPRCDNEVLDRLAGKVGEFVKTMFPSANVFCKAECCDPAARHWSLK